MPLNWSPDPSDPELFHITHVDNLPSIVASGGLFSDARVAAGEASPTTIGSPSIKARRLTWTLNLPDQPCVGAFVPFYFCPRSVMLYLISRGHSGWQGGQTGIVHLVTRVSAVLALGRRIVFTDRNAATAYHEAFENTSRLGSAIDWAAMPLERWAGDAKEARQAEFLVDAFVPWAAFTRVVAMNPETASRVRDILPGAARPEVAVDPSWYYP